MLKWFALAACVSLGQTSVDLGPPSSTWGKAFSGKKKQAPPPVEPRHVEPDHPADHFPPPAEKQVPDPEPEPPDVPLQQPDWLPDEPPPRRFRPPPVEVRPPPRRHETPLAALVSAVRLDDEQEPPRALLKPQVRIAAKGFAPEYCLACWKPGSRPLEHQHDQAYLRDALRDECPLKRLAHHPAINMKILVGEGRACPQYPAVADNVTELYYFGKSISTPNRFINSMNHFRMKIDMPRLTGSPDIVRAGGIDRDLVEGLLDTLDESGPLVLPTKAAQIEKGWLTVNIPAGVSATLSTDGDLRIFTFDPRKELPTIGIGPAKKTVSGVTIGSEAITLNLDWAPDVSWEFD